MQSSHRPIVLKFGTLVHYSSAYSWPRLVIKAEHDGRDVQPQVAMQH